MSKLTERAAYLKGLAEGLGLAPDTPERKLILALLDTMDEMATAMGAMEQRIQDAEDSIDEVSDDLADVEEIVYEDEDDECDCGCEDEQDDEVEFNEDDYIEYACPHCGDTIYYDPEDFDMEQPHPCPNCGKELFPEKE